MLFSLLTLFAVGTAMERHYVQFLLPAWLIVFAVSLALNLRKRQLLEDDFSMLFRKVENLQTRESSAVAESSIAEIREATQRLRHAREELGKALSRERMARASAEQANNAKDKLLAMLGHELRNPLSAVMNASTVALHSKTDETQRKAMLEIVHRQAGHLGAILTDMLDVSGVITGKVKLDRQYVNIGDVVRDVLCAPEVAGTLEDRRLDVDIRDAWIIGDKHRLEQIILNLILNAATYTRCGDRITVSTGLENSWLLFTVADDGIGISAADIPHVFELFFQAEQEAHRPYSGLGIGLTLVKQLVELHGGAVTADSAGCGKGATFSVRLPLAPASGATHSSPDTDACGRFARCILLVEDNKDARETLKTLLELDGHKVFEAAHGEKALASLEQAQPEIALLDIGLPDMDGYELAAAIRARCKRTVCLIAISGYGSEADKAKAKRAGFHEYLTKPVDFSALSDVIARRCTRTIDQYPPLTD